MCVCWTGLSRSGTQPAHWGSNSYLVSLQASGCLARRFRLQAQAWEPTAARCGCPYIIKLRLTQPLYVPELALRRRRMGRGDCWRTSPGPPAAMRPSAAYTSWTSTTMRRRPACPSAAWTTSWSRAGPRRALRLAAAAPDGCCMPRPFGLPGAAAGCHADSPGAPRARAPAHAPPRSRAGSETDWQGVPRQVPFTKAHVLAHPEYELMSMPHYFSANSAPWCAAVLIESNL